MEKLSKKYIDKLDEIAVQIQNSEALAKYLDEEEEEFYKKLQETFEPVIQEVYEEVVNLIPLQILSLEVELLNEKFEGLYLPRILGYSVLRGEVNDRFKYKRPQTHFKDILLVICNSANFEMLKQRIGQSIQVAFGLSSDIWITNLINQIINKKVKQFLLAQKLEKFRDVRDRNTSLVKFGRQFKSLNYHTAMFPSTISELKIHGSSLKSFLVYRASHNFDNSSLNKKLGELMTNHDFDDHVEFMELLVIIGMFFDLKGKNRTALVEAFNRLRNEHSNFDDHFFKFLQKLLKLEIAGDMEHDKSFSKIIDKSMNDKLSNYYNLIDILHSKGYVHDDAIEATRNYYDAHEGLSIENECLRMTILYYFSIFMDNITEDEYQNYIEINKTFIQYIGIFSNQKFNQDVKAISLSYIKKLIKRFTDKRGRDYQDIKKFVSSTFLDLGFMKQKELVELFKTRRKKKTA